MILGHGQGQPEPGSGSGSESGGRRAAGKARLPQRTSHAATDRLLSALLVEIDGTHSKGSRSGEVIVIATASDPGALDRYEC
jgi:hypothetical protein